MSGEEAVAVKRQLVRRSARLRSEIEATREKLDALTQERAGIIATLNVELKVPVREIGTLFGISSAAVTQILNRVRAPMVIRHAVTENQLAILALIAERGPVRAHTVAKLRGQRTTGAAVLVFDQLGRRGLVNVTTGEQGQQATITEAGKKVLSEMTPEPVPPGYP